ncbi:dihydrofolate reductase family protein [Rhodovulum sp. DZ06]|uniref:dihydrofolate reductase family protein n=1 Tax=Rhodovulum sp. DZ06 TaxID=3425126 RepID=UPI003D326F43
MPEGHVYLAVSMDGYIARKDGGLDWLDQPGAAGEDHGFDAFIAAMDGIVMGRKTYETVLSFGAWPYPIPVIVLSRGTGAMPVPEGAKVYRAAAPDKAWAQAAARGWRNVYVDGGETARAFMEKGRVSRLTLTRVPVLLGEGAPLFAPMAKAPRLSHLETRSFPSGLVQSTYALG